MRSIKFRYFWKKKWYYIDLYNDNTAEKFTEYESRNKTSELQQYTGLKDKNGVEIYEGDIVIGVTTNEFSYGFPFRYKIIWAIDRFHAYGTKFENLQEFLNYCDVKCEVIGNIHENPELSK